MPRTLNSCELRKLWRERQEVALFDAREEGDYALAHPFFAVSLPLSRLEFAIFGLAPRRNAPIVFYDDGEGVAEDAARRAEQFGFTDVRLLDGGLRAYAEEGELFRDVNVPCKAFGELVESICHTPSFSATEVKRLIEDGTDMVVLDVRRFEEYRTMSLPTGVSVPGGELALRVRDLAPSPGTLVIVNCAGRTRSIIGTQTLVNSGIPNKVAALRNGTIGWSLEGYQLEHGQTRRFGRLTDDSLAAARKAALRRAQKTGVRIIDKQTLDQWVCESSTRTLYRLDVRTPEEYAAAHPNNFISAPGGQLVQATDEWIAVRGARLVLFDDDGVRARMTGSWLAQMGWEVAVMETGALPSDESGVPAPYRPALPYPGPETITPAELAATLDTVVVIDLALSSVYNKGHIPDAYFLIRSRFASDHAILPHRPFVLTSQDGALATYSAAELSQVTGGRIRVLAGGTDAWRREGFPISQDSREASSPVDVYKRPYEGTDNAAEAMRGYIEWELQLVAQLANDGIANFRIIR